MHQLQWSWVRSQHPSAQWNLRGGRWSSVEYSMKKNHKIPQCIFILYTFEGCCMPVFFFYRTEGSAALHARSLRALWPQHRIILLLSGYAPVHLFLMIKKYRFTVPLHVVLYVVIMGNIQKRNRILNFRKIQRDSTIKDIQHVYVVISFWNCYSL